MGASGEIDFPDNIILFDGICNLCSASVQFIIRRDSRNVFRFASLQSTTGQRLLEQFSLEKSQLHSIILIKKGKLFQRSNAALEIAKELGGVWSIFYGFKMFPLFFRDAIYNWISRNRYKFFGKKNECWLPTPELKSRFID